MLYNYKKEKIMQTKIAVVAIIVSDLTAVERINSLLHENNQYIIAHRVFCVLEFMHNLPPSFVFLRWFFLLVKEVTTKVTGRRKSKKRKRAFLLIGIEKSRSVD